MFLIRAENRTRIQKKRCVNGCALFFLIKNKMMSSTKCEILCISVIISKPLILGFINGLRQGLNEKQKRVGLTGSHYLLPLYSRKGSDVIPLLITPAWGNLQGNSINSISLTPKPNYLRTENRYCHSTILKAYLALK